MQLQSQILEKIEGEEELSSDSDEEMRDEQNQIEKKISDSGFSNILLDDDISSIVIKTQEVIPKHTKKRP